MTIPEQEPTQPTEPHPDSRISARARRRRARRALFPKDAQGRAAVVAALAKRAYPTYELFLYSLLCGAVLGVGYFVDSYGVILLGILFAPLMAPMVGLTLSVNSGLPRLFFQTLAGLIVSALLIFVISAAAGLASRVFHPLPHTYSAAFTLSRLWIPDLVVMALGMVLLTVSFARSESKPYLPSVVVAYELFMPLSASAFGIGNGVGDLWPYGALVFLVQLAWAVIVGMITFAILRFRPLTNTGYVFTVGIFAVAIFTIFGLIDPSNTSPPAAPIAQEVLPTATETLAPALSETTDTPTAPTSATPTPPEPTGTESTPSETAQPTSTILDSSVTPVPLTLDVTLPVTETRTNTPAPEPTPVYAVIRAREGGGAYIRREPGGAVLATLDNGAIVQILPETREHNGALWINIVATRNEIRVEGWIIQSVLETATPVPNWEPSETPTPES